METKLFNQFLSHEKIFIKTFNTRNFDSDIGFYKSNDFSKVLEYYTDKTLLRVLSRCKESALNLTPATKELVISL